jgi:hypothetical protein
MANEPERPIEKLLRGAANKRRDEAGAPFELHPVNRRLLQGEVARQSAKPQHETHSFTDLLSQLWPRFVWGVAILAVLGVAAWLLLPLPDNGRPETFLAKNKSVFEAAPAKEPLPPMPTAPATIAPPPAPTVTPKPAVVAYADTAQPARANPAPLMSAPALPASPPAVAMTPAPASAVTADESAKLKSDKSGLSAAQYKSLAAAASANRPSQSPIATDALSKPAGAARKETKAFGSVQRFVQVAPKAQTKKSLADKAVPAQPVLASFQVEQAGQELRIVDGDGSVYSGRLQLATAARRSRAVKAKAPAATLGSRAPAGAFQEKAALSLDSDPLAAQTYFFRVAGTNRSLNKQVVFTGNLLTATNLALSLPLATNSSTGGGVGGLQNAPAQPVLLPLFNSRISGKLVIGTGKAVEINALPSNK